MTMRSITICAAFVAWTIIPGAIVLPFGFGSREEEEQRGTKKKPNTGSVLGFFFVF